MAVLARSYEEYLERGTTIAAIVIDPPEQNAAVVVALSLPFPILSDPGGEAMIKPFDVWDEAGQMSKPAIIVLSPDGREVYRYVGIDFVDRVDEADIIRVLDDMMLVPLDRSIEVVPHVTPAAGPRTMSVRDLSIYLRGVRSSTRALSDRTRDQIDLSEAGRTSNMAERYISALSATRRTQNSR